MNRTVLPGLLLLASVVSSQGAPGAMAVPEMSFGTGYDRDARVLTGEGSVFAAETSTIYCRTRITGAQEKTSVTHVWYHEGTTVAHVELTVGSPDWRTVSSKQLLPAWTGQWEVRVVDQAGNLLRAERFAVE